LTENITFKIQNHSHLADYCAASPEVELVGNDVLLSYDNAERIVFVGTVCFRVGDPNDEGFFGGSDPPKINDSMYSYNLFPKLRFGYFYEVLGFDWTNGLIGEGVEELVDRSKWKNLELKHFVYFMKDGTFECLCKSWREIL
jgi:hypothetical protein